MIRLSLATPDDDATLRALLRDNPMPSWVSMALTREPSFFAGANRFGREWAVLGRVGGNPGNAGDAGDAGEAGNSGTTSETGADGAGAVADDVVGMYACAEQPLHWNGVETAMAYLAGLRVAPRYRHRLRILKAGYASIRRFAHGRHSGPWFTAIASENLPARRLLEAGLRGLPRYRPLNEMVTLALPRARGRRHGAWRRAVDDDLADLCRFYNRQACRYQCAPALNPARVGATGASFYCLDGAAGLAAVMALWNQQDYKQVRACAYRPPLGALRPLYNGYARLAKRILLPSPGQALDQAFLAFLPWRGRMRTRSWR